MAGGKYRMHPLLRLFSSRGIFWRDGMNLLQDGPERFISDQCVQMEDVAPADVERVLHRAATAKNTGGTH